MGIDYNLNEDVFDFDFVSNSEKCSIEFRSLPLEKIKFLDKNLSKQIYYFGYEFLNNDYASSIVRTKFFHELKFNDNFTTKENKLNFIRLALEKLNDEINIHEFNLVIFPKSRSSLNRTLVDILFKITNTELSNIELVKEIPKKINFDFKKFESDELNSEINGRPRYTEKEKAMQLEKIKKMVTKIHNLDYFSIAESVRGNKYKNYFKNYLKISRKNSVDYKTILKAKNIILVDDVLTTSSTIFECLKSIRTINGTANIIIFTLVGKKEIIK